MRTVPIIKIDPLNGEHSILGCISLPETLLDEIGAIKPKIELTYSYRADDDKVMAFALSCIGAEKKNETKKN